LFLAMILCSTVAAAAFAAASGSVEPAASAQSLTSPHYQFEESVLGGGGLVQSSSANYQAGESIGEAAAGDSASANFQTQAGNKTTSDPTLSFAVNNSIANFGNFSPGTAATATSTFSVSNYTSYGYAVQIVGNPPTNGTYTIPALTTATPSNTGTEQFGINLVANTLPVSLGANPDHGQFGFGSATTNYGTSNYYRYVSGESIVSAPKSSGITNYTISYIVNVNSLTKGGQYASNQVIICTGTY
jgi:hypothetical protein